MEILAEHQYAEQQHDGDGCAELGAAADAAVFFPIAQHLADTGAAE